MEQSADTRKIKLLTFGRLNPGTPGHLALIQAMIDQALIYLYGEIDPETGERTGQRTGDPVIYFLLSKTQGGPDNPFECEETDPEDVKITKKRLFIKMISAMVQSNYPQFCFNINGQIYNVKGRKPPIIINVECSSNIFQAFPGIITEPENTIVHLFFGTDQEDFATTIETQLTYPKQGPAIRAVKSIVQRATVEGSIDI